MPECIVDKCENTQRSSGSFGWCDKHYKRWKRHGDTETQTPTRGMSSTERFQYYKTRSVSSDSGCVEWSGPCSSRGKSDKRKGYGISGKTAAHRMAWELHNGPIPQGMCVLHHCDNPPCINLDHLYLGTHQDNMKDMNRRNRNNAPTGEDHGQAKLTWVSVQRIRSGYTGKWGEQSALARRYGVSTTTIRNVLTNKIWKTE